MNYIKDDRIKAYTLLRLTMAMNMMAHGLVRLPKLDGFSTWMVGHFQNTFLPSFMVEGLAYSIPFVELLVGVLLLFGLFTKKALNLGAFLMVVLVFGSCLTEKWEWAAFQMIYGLFYFVLSYLIDMNKISLDYFMKSKEA